MKTKVLIPLTAVVLAALSSCAYDSYQPQPGYGQHPGGGYPPGRPGPGMSSNEAYNLGARDGANDRRAGRKYNAYRGQNSVPPAYQNRYRSGYGAGYQQGGGHGGGSGGGWGGGSGGGGGGGNWGGGGGQSASRETYNRGVQTGRADRSNGRRYNAAIHLKNIPDALRLDFTNGYAQGYNGRR